MTDAGHFARDPSASRVSRRGSAAADVASWRYENNAERRRDQAWIERERALNLRRSKRRGWLVPMACLTTFTVVVAGVVGGLVRMGFWPW